MLLSFFRPGKPGLPPAPPPPRTTGELLAMLGTALVARGLSVAIDPDGVTAATAGKTWRVAAVADDGPDARPAPCRCHAEPWADTMPRKMTATEQVRARLELLEYHRDHPWNPEG